jgi:hypothetical protein
MTGRLPILAALLFAPPTPPASAETATTPPDYLCKAEPASAEAATRPLDYLCKPVPAAAPASAETATVPPNAYPATAPPVRVNKIAVAGNTLIIGHFANSNPDCTASGRTFVRVSGNPSHGIVTMREGLGFSNLPKQPECNSHKMQGVTVEYTPYDGFTGSDEVEFDVVSQIGGEVFVTYGITVKAWDSSDGPNSSFPRFELSPSEAAPASGELPDHEVQGQVTEKPPTESSKAQAPPAGTQWLAPLPDRMSSLIFGPSI